MKVKTLALIDKCLALVHRKEGCLPQLQKLKDKFPSGMFVKVTDNAEGKQMIINTKYLLAHVR